MSVSDLTHILDNVITASPEHLSSSASLMKEVFGKSLFLTDSTHCKKKFTPKK